MKSIWVNYYMAQYRNECLVDNVGCNLSVTRKFQVEIQYQPVVRLI
jgi:hypothetical protein